MLQVFRILCLTYILTIRFHFVYHVSALRDVKIPPGPRLLILDHIERFDSLFLFSFGGLFSAIVCIHLIVEFVYFAQGPGSQANDKVAVVKLLIGLCRIIAFFKLDKLVRTKATIARYF